MIYTVECNYAEPASEAEWNAFYSLEKLPALISVSGFSSSQRFKALSDNCPAYLALHSVDTPAVLQSDEYRQKGVAIFPVGSRTSLIGGATSMPGWTEPLPWARTNSCCSVIKALKY